MTHAAVEYYINNKFQFGAQINHDGYIEGLFSYILLNWNVSEHINTNVSLFQTLSTFQARFDPTRITSKNYEEVSMLYWNTKNPKVSPYTEIGKYPGLNDYKYTIRMNKKSISFTIEYDGHSKTFFLRNEENHQQDCLNLIHRAKEWKKSLASSL